MKFLLDTDTCIYALKQNLAVLKNLLARAPEDIAVSVITEAELRTGAAKSASAAKTLRLVENFLRPIAIQRRSFVCSSSGETRACRHTHWSAGYADRGTGSRSQTGACFQ